MLSSTTKYESLEPTPSNSPRLKRWLATSLVTIIVASVIFTFNPAYLGGIDKTSWSSSSFGADVVELKPCASSQPPPVKPPAPINPWASLTVRQTSAIQRWLEHSDRNLNLTRADSAHLSDNVIFAIETFYPPKAGALAYLASPDTVSPPQSFAKVTIHHGNVPVIRDYLVGPLPIGSQTSMRHLSEIYHQCDIPFHAGGYATANDMSRIISSVAAEYEEPFMV